MRNNSQIELTSRSFTKWHVFEQKLKNLKKKNTISKLYLVVEPLLTCATAWLSEPWIQDNSKRYVVAHTCDPST